MKKKYKKSSYFALHPIIRQLRQGQIFNDGFYLFVTNYAVIATIELNYIVPALVAQHLAGIAVAARDGHWKCHRIEAMKTFETHFK